MAITIFTAPLAKEPSIPVGYTIRCTTTHCASCGYAGRQSEFLAHTLTRPRMGAGSPVKQWTECKRPDYDLPIDRVFIKRITPFCAECPAIDLSRLPPPPHVSRLNTLPDLVMKNQPAAKKPATKPRIEDLA